LGILLRLLGASALILTAHSAFAEGGISILQTDKTHAGMIVNRPTTDDASREVLDLCRRQSGRFSERCQLTHTFSNTCAAFAQATSGSGIEVYQWAVGTGATPQEAAFEAERKCQATGTTCVVRMAQCDASPKGSPSNLSASAGCIAGNTIVEHLTQLPFFSSDTVTPPTTCRAITETRKCRNGIWEGSPTFNHAVCSNPGRPDLTSVSLQAAIVTERQDFARYTVYASMALFTLACFVLLHGFRPKDIVQARRSAKLR
jgi:hypothetical protein